MKVIKRSKNPKNTKVFSQNDSGSQSAEQTENLIISTNISENLKKFKAFLGDSADAIFREFKLGMSGLGCAIVYIDGLTDRTLINDHILKPMMYQMAILETDSNSTANPNELYEIIKSHAFPLGDIKEAGSLDEAFIFLMSGEIVLIVDGVQKFLIGSARGWRDRGILEPQSEMVVRGPRDGFTETLRTNTALIRRRCRDPNLCIKTIRLGRRGKTDAVYMYIKGIVAQQLVEEVERRLQTIDVDIFLDSGQIEQIIQDNYLTLFPQIQVTERPDKTIANLLEGRVAILLDNSPFALIVPTTFYQFFQSPEDYYERWMLGSFARLLRLTGSLLASMTPALYIAMVSFHPGYIPTNLVLSIAATRATVPFPAFIEAILMEITFELLREAGARLPRAIGQTISIVGGLIIGDAAVRAGITSPIMIIVVAITAIASFIIPSYNAAVAVRMVRFPFMLIAASFGIYGVILFFIIICIHLVSLKSFGVDFLSPQSPFIYQDWKDFIIRLPQQMMKQRPLSYYAVDMDRRDQDPIKGAKT